MSLSTDRRDLLEMWSTATANYASQVAALLKSHHLAEGEAWDRIRMDAEAARIEAEHARIAFESSLYGSNSEPT